PPATRPSGLQNRGDALAARGTDRDQAAYRLTAVVRFGFVQLLGQLGEDASASRGKRGTGSQRRAVDVELGSVDRPQRPIEAEPLLAVLLGLPGLQVRQHH